ncbi:Solute carrier family 35 member G1 [Holothuria leucospilota]|uniref:Solute carrier family 35 member G1 n=1 Tax=Holothuria leucospilota TaxID=206669 RepID=A0A9Q1HCW5_HOLLE|nr:Solute carrier family 35 member G1 [Holothuria leucospilota]
MYDHRGIFFVVLGVFLYASSNVLYRFVQNEVHSMEIVFIIYLIQVLMTVPPITFYGSSPVAKSKKIFILMCVRGLTGVSGIISFFRALQYMPTGDATVIVCSAPIFVGIFARIFLKEAFGFLDIVLTFIVVAGVVLIAKPPFLFGQEVGGGSQSNVIGSAYAFGSCVSCALAYVINRKLGLLRVDSFVNVLHFIVIGTIVSAILNTVLGGWSIPPCGIVRFELVVMGTTTFVAQCLITYSYKIEKGIIVSLLQTNEVIFAYLLEFLFFSVTPDLIGLAGVVAVMSASVTSSVKKSEWVSSCRRKDKWRQEEVSTATALSKNGEQKETSG